MTRDVRRLLPGFIVLVLFLLHSADVLELPLVARMDHLAYDLRLRATAPGGIDSRVVIVAVDETSLQREGHWPWSRAKLGQLVTKVFAHGAAVVGFDAVFAERTDTDAAFAARLRGRPVILGYYFVSDPITHIRRGRLPQPALAAGDFPQEITRAITAAGYVANVPELQSAAAGAGFFDNPRVDEDGAFRRVPLLQRHDGALYEALSLAVVRAYLRQPVVPLLAPDAGVDYPSMEALRVGALRIPVDAEAAALVPFRGPQGSFPYVSAADVLQKRVPDPTLLRKAIVLVGVTAPGLYDLRATPVQPVYAGVEVHANLIAGMLDGRIPHRPAFAGAAEWALIAVIGTALFFLLPRLGALTAALVAIASIASVVAGNVYAWQTHRLALPLAATLLFIATLFVVNMAHGFFVEGRAKRHLARRFGEYVPPELVAEMSKDPERYTLVGEKRELTVLFSDVRGFTRISETLDPPALSELLNTLLTPMTRVIHEHRGTIDKYMGDAIMAFWGAPVPDAAHAANAVASALAMQRTLAQLRDDFRTRGWPAIEMGIGLSTGPMSVGNMGSAFRMAYTVLGDTVNLGARLEAQTKNYGARILVAEATRIAAPAFVYRELDRVRVKGKRQPVTIYEPLGLPHEVGEPLRAELALHASALAAYRAQDWTRAQTLFCDLAATGAQAETCRLFLWRIDYLRQHPPSADWDGVFVSRRREG